MRIMITYLLFTDFERLHFFHSLCCFLIYKENKRKNLLCGLTFICDIHTVLAKVSSIKSECLYEKKTKNQYEICQLRNNFIKQTR